MSKKFKKKTIASKAGIGTDTQYGSIVPPIYLGTNFEYKELGKEPIYEYTRQENPTRDLLIKALSDLEEGLGGEIVTCMVDRLKIGEEEERAKCANISSAVRNQ